MTLTLSLRPDVTVVAVLLPSEYNRFDAEMFWENDCMSFVNAKIPLPPGQYEIVGLLREFQEEQAAGLVEVMSSDGYTDTYKDYVDPGGYHFFSPVESLKSAIEANGGNPELNWLLLKKIQ